MTKSGLVTWKPENWPFGQQLVCLEGDLKNDQIQISALKTWKLTIWAISAFKAWKLTIWAAVSVLAITHSWISAIKAWKLTIWAAVSVLAITHSKQVPEDLKFLPLIV